jgi:Ca-activated chloride channel family protein
LQQPQQIYVLTELYPAVATAKQRLPLNFALLLDHSGSMSGDKLRTMKQAVNRIIDQLTEGDILSIVTFETRSKVLFPAGPVLTKDEIKHKVDRIQEAGGTNMAPALCEGINQVRQHHASDRINRVILLTDGEATDKDDDSRREADQAGVAAS